MTTSPPLGSSPLLGEVARHLFLRAALGGVELTRAAARQFASAIRDAYFATGEVVYLPDEPSDHLYFVVEGAVALEQPAEPARILGPRSLFGMLAAALDRPHARTARATADAHVMVLRVEDWHEMVEDHFELARAMILRIAREVHEDALRMASRRGLGPPPATRAARGPAGELRHQHALDTVERLLVLSEAPLFARAGIQPLVTLAQRAAERRLGPGDILFRVGEPATPLYVVAAGVVALERDDPASSAWVGPGALVEGPGALAHDARGSTASAPSAAVVLTLDRDHLFEVMQDHFAVWRSVMAYLAAEQDRLQRLEARTGSVREP